MEHTPILPAGALLESISRFLPSDAGIVPLSAVAHALAGFSRDQLGDTIELLVAMLDAAEPDSDLEPNGDELDGSGAEDDFCVHNEPSNYPGCPISDPDMGVEDDPLGIDPEEDLEHDGREPDEPEGWFCDRDVYREHKRRLQRTRCFPRYYYRRDFRTGEVIGRDLRGYQLLHDVPAPTRRQLTSRKRGMPRRPRP